MKNPRIAELLAIVFVWSILPVDPSFRFDSIASADDAIGKSANDDSGSSESKSVPLWRRGISTWTGEGYIQFPESMISPGADNAPGPKLPSGGKPYTVPVDPSAPTITTSPAASSIGAGFQLPGIRANPLAIDSGDLRSSQAVTMDTANGGSSLPLDDAALPNHPVTETRPLASPRPAMGDSALAKTALEEQGVLPVTPSDSETAASVDLVDYSVAGPTITDHLDAGVAVVQPPLHEEAVRWYQYPWRWMRSGWTNHAEFGLDGSSGNSDTLAIQTGLELKRKTEADTFAVDFDYRFVTSQDVTTEDNGRLNLDYDRLLGDTPWSSFGKFGMEWDTFKAFDLRLNLNAGVGYHWVRNDRSTLVSRFGAGASKEIGAPDDAWIPEAVFGLDGEHRINKYHKIKGKVDYFPAWENFNDFRLVSDLGWEILLDDEDNLSLKLAVTDRYDSTPQGAEKNDWYYSLLLLVKF